MGILERFSNIMKSNVNSALDKMEDPSKMIDQTLLNLRKDLADVKKETAAVIANAKNARRKVDECKKEIESYTETAKKAILAGNDEDAKKLLKVKQEKEEKLVSLQQTCDLNEKNAEKMREMHDKIVADINELEEKRDAIKAKMATAKAQEHINKVISGSGSARAAASIDAFDRYEAKADKMMAEAEAMSELNNSMEDDDAASLLEKYESGGDADADAELARMKAEMGL